MIAVAVRFDIDPEHVADFRGAVLKQADDSLAKEVQCRQFDVCVQAEAPTSVFLYEIYDDRAAFDAHLATEHFAQFSERTEAWVVGKEVGIWDIVSSCPSN